MWFMYILSWLALAVQTSFVTLSIGKFVFILIACSIRNFLELFESKFWRPAFTCQFSLGKRDI